MPFVLLPLVVLLPLAYLILLPVAILQRYRLGTSRRLGRSWVATLNVVGLSGSVVIFIAAAAAMSVWLPVALLYALGGLVGGSMLGLLGLKLTRWEPTARTVHYTPPRPLVLAITLLVAARICYGFWRMWHAWEHGVSGASWLVASGAAGSLGVGALVLGYYLTYWIGVARRLKRHRHANRWQRAGSSA